MHAPGRVHYRIQLGVIGQERRVRAQIRAHLLWLELMGFG
jgi:hypothetical protein